ncbi:MAG: Hpt domain-containing protein [Oligoflexia bacterium]|nr:Hpt domain-containing protein [Oligoflexia bacterium]
MDNDELEFLKELRDEFFQDTPEQLDSCEECILAFKDTSDNANLDKLKRTIHSLKGSAQAVDLAKMASHFHKFETIIAASAGKSDKGKMVIFLLSFIDNIRTYLTALKTDGDCSKIENSLTTLLNISKVE